MTYLPLRDDLCFPPHGGNAIRSVKHALWPQPEHLHHHIPVPASIGITSHSSNWPLQEGMLGGGEKMKHLEDFWPCRCLDDFQRRLYWIFKKSKALGVQRFVSRQILNLCPIIKNRTESTHQWEREQLFKAWKSHFRFSHHVLSDGGWPMGVWGVCRLAFTEPTKNVQGGPDQITRDVKRWTCNVTPGDQSGQK